MFRLELGVSWKRSALHTSNVIAGRRDGKSAMLEVRINEVKTGLGLRTANNAAAIKLIEAMGISMQFRSTTSHSLLVSRGSLCSLSYHIVGGSSPRGMITIILSSCILIVTLQRSAYTLHTYDKYYSVCNHLTKSNFHRPTPKPFNPLLYHVQVQDLVKTRSRLKTHIWGQKKKEKVKHSFCPLSFIRSSTTSEVIERGSDCFSCFLFVLPESPRPYL